MVGLQNGRAGQPEQGAASGMSTQLLGWRTRQKAGGSAASRGPSNSRRPWYAMGVQDAISAKFSKSLA